MYVHLPLVGWSSLPPGGTGAVRERPPDRGRRKSEELLPRAEARLCVADRTGARETSGKATVQNGLAREKRPLVTNWSGSAAMAPLTSRL